MSYRADKHDNVRIDTHTDTQTDTQTQAMTIPEGQNWPRVKIQNDKLSLVAFILSFYMALGFGLWKIPILEVQTKYIHLSPMRQTSSISKHRSY